MLALANAKGSVQGDRVALSAIDKVHLAGAITKLHQGIESLQRLNAGHTARERRPKRSEPACSS